MALTGATVWLDVSLLLYTEGGQAPLGFVFVPFCYAVAVGILIGVDSLARVLAERVRRA